MILRKLILVLALGCSLTSPLFAGGERGEGLIAQTGGAAGAAGIAGLAGTAGAAAIFQFADFFALMPGDNSASVAPNTAVEFPQNGPAFGFIARTSASQFLLPFIGTYKVYFQVTVTEPGQLQLRLTSPPGGAIALPFTVAGRASGTTQIVGMSIVTTTAANSILEVINPTLNATALGITPANGSETHSFAAELVIIRIL